MKTQTWLIAEINYKTLQVDAVCVYTESSPTLGFHHPAIIEEFPHDVQEVAEIFWNYPSYRHFHRVAGSTLRMFKP